MKTIDDARDYLNKVGFTVTKGFRRSGPDEDWEPFGWQTNNGNSILKFNNDDDLIGFARAIHRVMT